VKREKTMFCPSVSDGAATFTTSKCERSACIWWKNGCSAQKTERKRYAVVPPQPVAPPCPKAAHCRWHNDAAKLGLPCLPRSLGMLCEHAGGEWNTFDMADPKDWST
jgi:hypothetical protein